MTASKLRLAFLGGGLNSAVGRVHSITSQMDGQFRLVAGCFSRHRDVNLATADAWGVPRNRTHRDIDELIDQESGRLDAVVVLTPTPTHAGLVAELLERGFNVICEKSLTTSTSEVDTMLQDAPRQGPRLLVCFNYSAYPMVREARARVRAGAIGRVQRMAIAMPQEGFLRLRPDGTPPAVQEWRSHDGTLPTVSLDLGTHVQHLARFIIGANAHEAVSIRNHNGLVGDVIDSVDALVRYDNGVTAQVSFGKTSLGFRNGLSFQVFGDEGSIRWEQETPERLHCATNGGDLSLVDPGSPGLLEAAAPRYNRFKPGHPSGFLEAFANLYQDFAVTLRGDVAHDAGGPLAFGGVEAALGLAELEAFEESNAESRWVPIRRQKFDNWSEQSR